MNLVKKQDEESDSTGSVITATPSEKVGDNRLVVIAQIGLIYCLVVFSCVSMGLGHKDQIYIYILSMCIGLIFPAPKLKRNGK